MACVELSCRAPDERCQNVIELFWFTFPRESGDSDDPDTSFETLGSISAGIIYGPAKSHWRKYRFLHGPSSLNGLAIIFPCCLFVQSAAVIPYFKRSYDIHRHKEYFG